MQKYQHNPDPAVLFVWALFSLILVCYGMATLGAPIIKQIFILYFPFIPARFGNSQGLPSLLLHVLMHANLTHLLVNLGMLVAFGIPLVKKVRPTVFFLIFCTAAIAGVLAEFIANPQGKAPLIGASAAIAGLMGALCSFAIVKKRVALPGPFEKRKFAWRFVAAWIILNIIIGIISPVAYNLRIAWIAHIAGFLGGLSLSSIIIIIQKK